MNSKTFNMEQYINKSALIAEIERRIKERDFQMKSGCWVSSTYMYEDLLDFINTLEVKEVREETVNEDLEEAAEEYAPDFSNSIASKAAVDAIRDAFKAGAQWQALHSLETIKGMEEQAFLSGVEAEQINKSFSKEELLNRWRNKL
jgi:hypothetical protein